jgi:FkbM family methyltransferase
LKGARKLQESQHGNVLIRLNADSSLGPKGTVLEVPKDKIIYQELRHRGEWEKEVSKFLSECIRDLKKKSQNITFLDLGANIGLISLQAINNLEFSIKLIAVEPLPQHISALERNLKSISRTNEVLILPVALGLESKMEYIYKQNTNSGNTSLFARVVPTDQVSKVRIQMLNTEEFARNYLQNDHNFVIKSNLQGFDAKVLARLGAEIWKKTYAASVEVWALKEIEEQDVLNLVDNWKYFDRISWSSSFNNMVTLEEVKEFWLSGTNTHRNVYLGK